MEEDMISKEDWEKTLTEANQGLKDMMISAAVFRNTAKLARQMIADIEKAEEELDKAAGKSEEGPSKVKQ